MYANCMKKPIFVEANMVPNLLQFVLVGLEAGDFHKMAHLPYREECVTWISQEQKDLFAEAFSNLKGVSSSTWFALLYQIPSYLAEDSLDSLLGVLDLLGNNDTISVIERYPKKCDLIWRYIPKSDFHMYTGFKGRLTEFWSRLLDTYSDIVEDVFERIYSDRWEIIKSSLDSVIEILGTDYLNKIDWISWWENRTGIEFVYPQFQVEMIDAMTTMGTSLLAERDGFYAHANPLKITTMISHEICTHMLFSSSALTNNVVAPLIKEDLEQYLRTVEIISWATNKELIDELGLDWTMEKSFDWIGSQKGSIASLVKDSQFSDYWEIMEKGYSLMGG